MQVAKIRREEYFLTRVKGQQMDTYHVICSKNLAKENVTTDLSICHIYFRNPTPLDSEKQLVSTTWQPVTSIDDLEYLHIESPNRMYMSSGLLKHRVSFWSSLHLDFKSTAYTHLQDEL
jgi:aldehyde:ferredoxin oxidoreductase